MTEEQKALREEVAIALSKADPDERGLPNGVAMAEFYRSLADVAIALVGERMARVRAENEKLRAALRNCIGLLDGLVAESGRSIEWGEEDPFRMGEWFEVEDLEQIKEARAALAAPSGALEEKQ